MKNILQYSLAGLVQKIRNTKENYETEEDSDKKEEEKMSPVTALLILGIILFLTLGIWIWALVVLVKYWQILPDWAKIVGIIGILPIIPFGPVITLLCVYIGKGSGNSPLSNSSSGGSSGGSSNRSVSNSTPPDYNESSGSNNSA